MVALNNTYLFLRHGFSMANEKGLICSTMENGVKQDYKLTTKGIEQAKEGGQALKKMMESMPGKPVFFVSSPFSRAMETGTIVAAAIGITPEGPNFEVNNDLRERFYGLDLELKSAADNYPNVFKEDESSNGAKGPGSGGESANAVAERVRSVVKELEAKHKGAVIVLSCHQDVCTIGYAALTGGNIGAHYKSPLANCELKRVN